MILHNSNYFCCPCIVCITVFPKYLPSQLTSCSMKIGPRPLLLPCETVALEINDLSKNKLPKKEYNASHFITKLLRDTLEVLKTH